MKKDTLLGLIMLLMGISQVLGAIEYPAIPNWQPDPAQRENLRRVLTLLSTSTVQDRHTVRVLFYGQSITQQKWWEAVAQYLKSTYTNADLVIENRAIGGHSSQLLVKTAEADLYPFQPDLVIFHVYGSHIEYENIIKRIRERTCADILLQTDHITSDASLIEEMDRTKLTPKQWDPWMNHVFLPDTAAKYGACRADNHELWKTYLQTHKLKASDLLRDGVHLNEQGEWLMAELLKPYLAPLPAKAGYDPYNDPRVKTMAVPANGKLEFTGSRVDLVFKPGTKGPVKVLIDGRKPSQIPELYTSTRVSSFPNSDWPILLKVNANAPMGAEDWFMKIKDASADGKVCHFSINGSVTGDDGEGVSTNKFVSKSGKIMIEPEDWNLGYCVAVFKRALPENHVATWKRYLLGRDTAVAPAVVPGVTPVVTIAQGLNAAKHQLELSADNLGQQVESVRVYAPQP